MKLFATLTAVLLAATGCEKANSKLDGVTRDMPKSTSSAPGVSAGASASGSLEERVARLEKYGEALEFLQQVYNQQKQAKQAEEDTQAAEDAVFAVPVQGDVANKQVEGPATAPVTIVKAFDFACPYCMKSNDTMKELVAEYGGKVRVVYKNLVVHPDSAMPGHLGSCAAGKQGKYTEFKNAFWEKGFTPYMNSRGQDTKAMSKDNVLAIAKGLGLDATKFAADMDSTECKTLVDGDAKELAAFRVNSTPTFFINGRFVAGALPKDAFKEIIDEKLKVAEASGVPGAEYYDKEVLGKGEKQFRSKKQPKP